MTKRSTNFHTRKQRDHAGQAAVEFALVMVIFLVLVWGIIEVSRVVFINSEIGNAAREATQYLSLHSNWSGDVSATATAVVATAETRAKQKLAMADRDLAVVTVPTYNRCTFCVVRVTITYPWSPLVRIPALPDIMLESTATKLIENGTP